MSDTSLPCPFCGGKSVPWRIHPFSWRVICVDCDARGGEFSSGEKAISGWNKRVTKVGVWECKYVPVGSMND